MMNFTNDEMNLMCIYQSDSRSGLIAALTEMRGYLDEDEAELRELTDSALQKAQRNHRRGLRGAGANSRLRYGRIRRMRRERPSGRSGFAFTILFPKIEKILILGNRW